MLLKIVAENNDNILADVFVHFYDNKERWVLKGRWDGYDIKGKGYLEVPYANKMYHNDEIGEIFTAKHSKLTRKQMRVIWDCFQKKEFELEDHFTN